VVERDAAEQRRWDVRRRTGNDRGMAREPEL
jgi:hypothetical protein